jgi:hypothetical protein
MMQSDYSRKNEERGNFLEVNNSRAVETAAASVIYKTNSASYLRNA